MKTIGSHPGAILFRMSIMVILIAILVVVFFSYINKAQEVTERAAISRTKGIIDSSIAVVFATYAAQAKLDKINSLDGANPFEFLREYMLLPSTYMGEIDHGLNDQMAPGWYYLIHRRRVVYKSHYLGSSFEFELVLNYDDVNQSGRFEPEFDVFDGLYFMKIENQDEPF
jgi:hypothetical protein